MLNNSSGSGNVATGTEALKFNTAGSFNVAIGESALLANTTGINNTAIGPFAGENQTTGSNNVYIGFDIVGVAGEENHTYIRNINTTSVNGGSADSVTIDLINGGLLGHASSSKRYKEDIKPMDKESEVLFGLKPVSYRYKKDIDKTQSLDYGLVAEDVAKVDPNLAIRDGKGQIENVRYNAIDAMLLNEFLKEHSKVEAQESKIQRQETTISELKSIVAQQRKSFASELAEQRQAIKLLTAGLEKVNVRLYPSASAAKAVTYDQSARKRRNNEYESAD
jgi:uncharacterized coiled-coil protein SlyX